jgi:hypothetical protein
MEGSGWLPTLKSFRPWTFTLCQLDRSTDHMDRRLCEPQSSSARSKEQIVICTCHANTCKKCLEQIVAWQLNRYRHCAFVSTSCLGLLPLLAYAIYCVRWVLNTSFALIVSSCHLSIYMRDGDSHRTVGVYLSKFVYVLLPINTVLDYHRGEYLNCWFT